MKSPQKDNTGILPLKDKKKQKKKKKKKNDYLTTQKIRQPQIAFFIYL